MSTQRNSDTQTFRTYLDGEGVDHSAWTDEYLSSVIQQAKDWLSSVPGRLGSWMPVAENILCEGQPGRDDE